MEGSAFELKDNPNYNGYMSDIYRRFTAVLPSKKFIALYLRDYAFLVLIILMGFLLEILVDLTGKIRVAQAGQTEKVGQYQYWSGVASQYPTVPDILYNASLSAYNIGNMQQAKIYIEKALVLDPLFKKAQELRDKIEKE